MNNYYTLHSLVAELRYEISGKEISEVWSSRKDQIDFFFRVDPVLKLTFSAASPMTALFLDKRAAPPSNNAASFFHELHGSTVADVIMPSPDDRYILITITGSVYELQFKPFGSRPNVFLVNDGRVVSSFKNSQESMETPAPVNSGTTENAAQKGFRRNESNSGIPSATVDKSDTQSSALPSGPDPELPLRKRIIAIDRQFPRGLIDDLSETCALESLDGPGLISSIRELAQMMLHPQTASITAEGNLSLLPEKYLAHPPARTFNKVNDAVRTLFLSRQREKKLLPGKKDLEKRLQRRISGLQRQLDQFGLENDRLDRADELEQTGHLLMSQPEPDRKAGTGRIMVTDWLAGGHERAISVTPGVTLVQQAREYYAKAARMRKDVAMAARKKEMASAQLHKLEGLLRAVSGIEHPAELEKWLKKHAPDLQQFGLGSTQMRQVARPFRLVKVGNYDVWIGKNAKSNDEILALSHKEDVWMHARGTTGSHVIIRTGGDSGWPDPQVVRKVASWAAAYSRQAGSSLVPVMVAKRKHVRKPKGAAPGQVAVTRERVEMVRPQKPDASEPE
jgi:predicted ribosome quality control (RQC) complex YloA/Tae2 family protein